MGAPESDKEKGSHRKALRPRRPKATGSIETIYADRTRTVVRGYKPSLPPLDGTGRRICGPVSERWEDAEATLNVMLKRYGGAGDAEVVGLTWEAWGQRALELRELSGYSKSNRSTERSRWNVYVSQGPLRGKLLAAITAKDAVAFKAWVGKQKNRGRSHKEPLALLDDGLRRHVLNLARSFYALAIREQKVAGPNPFVGVSFDRDRTKVDPKRKDRKFFRPEQFAKFAELNALFRWPIACAMYTGLREGELYSLRTKNVHLDIDEPFVAVLTGAGDELTKSGDYRRVPLLPCAVDAFRAWIKVRDGWCRHNPKGLMFPTRFGSERRKGRPLGALDTVIEPGKDGRRPRQDKRSMWTLALQSLGLPHLPWHALRHTAATGLLAGWFGGEPWSKEAVQVALGHASIRTTEIYANLVDDVAFAAARKSRATTPPQSVQQSVQGSKPGPAKVENLNDYEGYARPDSNGRHPASKTGSVLNYYDSLHVKNGLRPDFDAPTRLLVLVKAARPISWELLDELVAMAAGLDSAPLDMTSLALSVTLEEDAGQRLAMAVRLAALLVTHARRAKAVAP